ncbi:hypothetical protein [Helicobacter suis]|uniref:hypothetical protein n=1 Tax=Helicobacter suis TaxID=104628 RepID=UPI001966FFA7|nr:hypothetical protein [Helicobacter suis]
MNFIEDVLKQGKNKLVVDARSYAHKVLMQHKPYPWHDAVLYSNYMKQVVSLLKADALVLRFDKMLEEELTNNKDLVEKMGEKKRSGYALKIFMQDEGLREITSSLINTATNTLHMHILTQLPNPLELLKMTAKAVGASEEFENETIENAAVYCADWLRSYKDSKVSGLVFDERSQSLPPETYAPISNVATNYGWSVGFRHEKELQFGDFAVPVLDSEFWCNKQAIVPDFKQSFFTEIDQDAIPEVVLEKLSTLLKD